MKGLDVEKVIFAGDLQLTATDRRILSSGVSRAIGDITIIAGEHLIRQLKS